MASCEVNGSKVFPGGQIESTISMSPRSRYQTLSVLASRTGTRTKVSMLLGGLHNLVSSEDVFK